MKIKIESEDELMEVAKEALHLLVNIRHYTKAWEETHGAELKNRKKHFEGRADEFLKKLEMEKSLRSDAVHISINNENQETQ